MSGHSKWNKIHRQKGVADAKRGVLFTRFGNAITAAAKTGGGDPETNFRLRLVVEKARAANMTKDNIDKAIKRGTGELTGGNLEAVRYEGFGPDGVALIIDCLTDNRNRTSSELKHILAKHGGSLGGPNSVAWLFEQKGVIQLQKISEDLELELIDAGVEEITKDAEGTTIYTKFSDLKKIKDRLESKGLTLEAAEIDWLAKEKKIVSQKELLEQLFEALDQFPDLNDYYSNAQD